MSERCFMRVKWDAATTPGRVRRAVGGFLRYIQHRDLHPGSEPARPQANVAGLVKYVAYRDRASTRAELFGPQGGISSIERKQFAEYVAQSIEESKPQLFRTRDGRLLDRRRSVSRFVISPERAAGLDLEALLRAGVSRLEAEMGFSGLRWIAAIHRNTAKHHLHLVLAGLHLENGVYRRVDITKGRLAAIKEAFGLEIERQRGERQPERDDAQVGEVMGGTPAKEPALKPPVVRPVLIRTPPMAPPAISALPRRRVHAIPGSRLSVSILRLRAAARRYQRRMQHDADQEARQFGRERAA